MGRTYGTCCWLTTFIFTSTGVQKNISWMVINIGGDQLGRTYDIRGGIFVRNKRGPQLAHSTHLCLVADCFVCSFIALLTCYNTCKAGVHMHARKREYFVHVNVVDASRVCCDFTFPFRSVNTGSSLQMEETITAVMYSEAMIAKLCTPHWKLSRSLFLCGFIYIEKISLFLTCMFMQVNVYKWGIKHLGVCWCRRVISGWVVKGVMRADAMQSYCYNPKVFFYISTYVDVLFILYHSNLPVIITLQVAIFIHL